MLLNLDPHRVMLTIFYSLVIYSSYFTIYNGSIYVMIEKVWELLDKPFLCDDCIFSDNIYIFTEVKEIIITNGGISDF